MRKFAAVDRVCGGRLNGPTTTNGYVADRRSLDILPRLARLMLAGGGDKAL